MSNPFDRLRGLFGNESDDPKRRAPQTPLHALPREQLRAAFSLALGPGVSRRLSALGRRPIAAVDRLEHLLIDRSSATNRRFGAMLRELSSPDMVVLSLLLRDAHDAASPSARLEATRAVCSHLELAADSRHLVEFLTHDDLRMSAMASGALDPHAIETFAAYLNKASMFTAFTTEDHLKALCLMTLAILDSEGALTPERSEQLWRLFADTYNYLTKTYGDEVIDHTTVRRIALNTHRPADISEQDLIDTLAGLPRRYLTLFDPASIFDHVRMCRNIRAGEVHCFLAKAGGGLWELTVATLDKPSLFSQICGVLTYLNADIRSGQAMTSGRGVALGVFRFHDDEGVLERHDPKPLLGDVIAGRVDVEHLLTRVRTNAGPSIPAEPAVVTFDNGASARYTVIEIVAPNRQGLLYRVSEALSNCGCEIELVVIATEGSKAHDIFHITRGNTKVGATDRTLITHEVEQACHF
jgi:UTP:GlnB (protein PII) uridylyltransferase